MRTVPRLRPVVVSIALASSFLATDVSAEAQPRVELRRERPDDAFKPPATRTSPGFASSSATWTIIQANVAPGGVNIVGDAANEPSIAVDPNFPNRMAIGWRQFNSVSSNFREAGYAYSTDGGRTWSFPGSLTPGVFRSDPVLDVDANGRFYYLSLRVEGDDFWCEMFKSWDHGATWSPPAYAFGGDKAWMAIDRTGGFGAGNVYQAWSTAAGCCADSTFNRSVNGGTQFSVPQQIPQSPIWGTMAVGADGTLFIPGVDPDSIARFHVARSANAQNFFVTPTFDVAPVDLDGNISFFVGSSSPNPGGLLGQVVIAVDDSGGPHAGNIYLVCSLDPTGADPLDVHFVRSTDGGVTWSAPVRINDDPSGNYQWFATMSVAPNGRIDVVWNDTRGQESSRWSRLMYSFSTDGGLSWSPNTAIGAAWDSFLGWPNQQKIGDYYDMVSDDVGAHLAWAATFNGEQDVYYTRINDYDCNGNGVGDVTDISQGTSPDSNGNGIPDECEVGPTAVSMPAAIAVTLHPNVPNPFNPSTVIRYKLSDGVGAAALRVYDVDGRLVRTLVDGPHGGGPGSATWDGRDEGGSRVSSGVYFYRLTGPGFQETRKMVLLK